MADEENPFGGGPFGVGPFGPLVAVAVAAATTVNAGATVTTNRASIKTLHYQSIAFVAVPDDVLNPPVAGAESFSVTTGRASSKSLFYQARIGPPQRPTEEVVVANISWHAPFSTPPSRQLVLQRQQYQPFVPPVAPQITAAQWLPRWQGPPSYHPAPAGGSPFVPREAVLDNTVTPDAWMPRWQKAVPSPRPIHTQPAFGYPYEAAVVSNLTTTLEWQVAWQGTKRSLLPLAGGVVNVPLPSNLTTTLEWQAAWRGPPRVTPTPQGGSPFVPKEAVLENTQTPDKWLQAWKGPPRYTPAPQGGSPFIPKEATLENTVTPDKWLVRFQGAVPVPPVHHTQPFLGYPYQAASNLTATLEWMPTWRGPPAYRPIKVQVPPFVPKADIVDQVTPDKWLQAWRGPPRAVPAQAGGSPFVPKEAVLENTQTPDKWLVRFAKAVPVPKPVPTQPVFGYPYVSQAIVVPYEQWWHQPLSRAAARPPVHSKPYQPFVPKEAVLENTQTPDKWLQRWQAPPAYRPIKVQTPPFVYTPPAPVTLTTTLEWQQPLSVAVKARPVRHTQPTLYLPAVVVVAEAAEAEHFSVTWAHPRRKTLFYQAKIAPAYVPPFVENTETPDKWLRPLSIAVKRPPVWPTRLSFGFPYVTEVEGGPADEPERVICIREQSRVAVVPETLRTAAVLVSSREAIVPELSRTVEALFSNREEDSNKFTTLPCVTVAPEPEQDAFQVDDAFQDSGFQ